MKNISLLVGAFAAGAAATSPLEGTKEERVNFLKQLSAREKQQKESFVGVDKKNAAWPTTATAGTTANNGNTNIMSRADCASRLLSAENRPSRLSEALAGAEMQRQNEPNTPRTREWRARNPNVRIPEGYEIRAPTARERSAECLGRFACHMGINLIAMCICGTFAGPVARPRDDGRPRPMPKLVTGAGQ